MQGQSSQLVCQKATKESQEPDWTTYTAADGLENNSVSSVFVDSGGVLYAGTGGVSVYDGTNWTTLTNTDTLGLGTVASIFVDSAGVLYASSGGALDVYDGSYWTRYSSLN